MLVFYLRKRTIDGCKSKCFSSVKKIKEGEPNTKPCVIIIYIVFIFLYYFAPSMHLDF